MSSAVDLIGVNTKISIFSSIIDYLSYGYSFFFFSFFSLSILKGRIFANLCLNFQ